MSEENNFNIPPPEYQEPHEIPHADIPPSLDAAWILSLIKIHLPKELQDLLVPWMTPILDTAARTNIKRHEIPMHLIQYDLIWQGYQIFMQKGKHDPKLFIYKRIIEEAFELQLCRGVEGWQGELVFTRKNIWDVKQTKGGRSGGFLDYFKTKKEPQMEEQAR